MLTLRYEDVQRIRKYYGRKGFGGTRVRRRKPDAPFIETVRGLGYRMAEPPMPVLGGLHHECRLGTEVA